MTTHTVDIETMRLRARVRFLRGLGASLSSSVRRLIATLAAARREHQSRRYLSSITDRQLNDMGVTRADIEKALR